MKLADFFENVYRPNRLFGKSANTTRLYKLSIRSFEKTLARIAVTDDVTDDNVRVHMQRVLDAGRSIATANKDRNQLFALGRYAFQLGYSKSWPSMLPLIEPDRTPEAWLPEEFAKLIQTVENLDDFVGSVPRRFWWKALILTLLDTGERIGAMRVAEWSWFSGEWVNVPAEARKGRRRDKAYKLSTQTRDALAELRQRSPKEPFHWPYNDNYLWMKFAAILDEAGLPHGRRDKFHKLRRTLASVVDAHGMDAQKALDHAYSRTTKKYLDPRFKSDSQPCDALADYLRNPPRLGQSRRDVG